MLGNKKCVIVCEEAKIWIVFLVHLFYHIFQAWNAFVSGGYVGWYLHYLGLRKRHKDHVKASTQETKTNLSSKFYTACPDPGKNGQTKGTSGGTFRQLRQVTGVRFKASMKNQVIELFSWEEHVVKKLEQKKLSGAPQLVDKRHRMVCYFFEKMFDLMIAPYNNLSSNAGFESFTGDWNRAQVN